MAFEYNGTHYIEPQDLRVESLGFLPRLPLGESSISSKLGRDFLGPDEIIALLQVAVSRSVDYRTGLLDELEKIISDGKSIPETIFRKNLSGIGRGHSLDGLPVVALGINGTKMIDSAFTGMVYSRSLVTSGRRRETKTVELVVPNSISAQIELLDEYLKITHGLFQIFDEIKNKFANKVDAIQAFNKLKPYNDPADLFYVLPMSSLVNLAVAVDEERKNRTSYLPEECAIFINRMEEIADDMGVGQIFRMRKSIPRETYLHYCVFKRPEANYATGRHEEYGNPLSPEVVRIINDLSNSAIQEFRNLAQQFATSQKFTDAAHLYALTSHNKESLSNLCRRYNDALNIQTISSLSWRVWSEQKRHGTLAQQVESIYSAAGRAYSIVRELWPQIESNGNIDTIVDEAEKAFVISDEMKTEPELLKEYIHHTSRQIMFYGKLVENNIPERDALYTVPRNIRVRTLESYDLINAISLELPLRLCTECEPERRLTSEIKAAQLKKRIPELAFLFEPKCNLGFCTEGKFCKNIMRFVPNYNMDIHKEIAGIVADAARG